jgi:hypothetical protein
MKKSSFLSFLVLSFVLLAFSQLALAEVKVATVPVGTTFEQTGTGQFRLKGPDGCVFEIKGFHKTVKGAATFNEVGILGDCGIVDKNGKLVATGTKGLIKSGPKPVVRTPGDSIRIAEYTIWLPATIEFTPVRIFNRPALLKMCLPAGQTGTK